jgi:predicted nucleic acid-binding protein
VSIIIDTSVWIDHLRKPVQEVVEILENENALSHSWIVGELSTGQIKDRSIFLGNLKLLPQAKEASLSELLEFIEEHRLFGLGLSLIDIQVLASTLLSDAQVLTRDRAMQGAAKKLKILHE